jgi:hypothetical protein
LGRDIGIKHHFSHWNLSVLVKKSPPSSFTSLKIIVSQFSNLLLVTPCEVYKFLKALREDEWFSKLSHVKETITEGVHFLHDSVMLHYCIHDKHDKILNELKMWWQELVKLYFRLPEDCIANYHTIHSVLTNSHCTCSAKMMDIVKQEILHEMQSGNFIKTITLANFYLLYQEISCISQQVVEAVLKHHHLMCLPSEKDPAHKLMNSALERFRNIEMSRVVSSVMLKATVFQQDGHALDVLLHMDMPLLFSISAPNMRNICQKFITELKGEIENKVLKSTVQDCFLKWLVRLDTCSL